MARELLDLRDKKMLRELDMNAKMSRKVLARRLRLSKQAVLYRIGKMQERGLLLGAITIFDSAVVGKRWFRVVLQTKSMNKDEKLAFIEFFGKHPNIVWLGEVGGNWDYVINFMADDQFAFNEIFEQILSKWGHFIQKYEVLTYINIRDQERAYLLPDYKKKRQFMLHEMRYNREVKLDDLDRRIIGILSKDAWKSALEIGNSLGVSYKTVQNRIRALEQNGVILGYRLIVHPRKLGYESYMLFLGIHVYRPELEKKLYEFLDHPNVTFLVKHLGTWRIGMEVEVSSAREFQDFLIELRSRFGDIISAYETFPIFHDHVINYFPEACLK
ncbi:MAG: AsnC family transcriptional regulator [Candidatus Micrarchaeota archaeon]|nr:AsnC family transcriptional regulator [Candidatus Micrarchaeota archaeon]